jgi:hypothetical protein
VAVGLVMLGMFVFLFPKIHVLAAYPLENYRLVCEAGRWKHEKPYALDGTSVETVSIWRSLRSYDPRLNSDRIYRTPNEDVSALRQKVADCRRDGRTLYFLVGNLLLAKVNSPELLSYLKESGDFELVQVIDGQESTLVMKLYRMRG